MSYVRINLYCGCALISMGYGLFFTMPLYLRMLGADESVSGSIILAGALGTITTVMMMAKILRRVPAHIVIASGALIYAIGAAIFVSANAISSKLYVASVLLGAGWGTTFTLGPILLSRAVTDAQRSFYFSILSAFNALGMGLAPIVTHHLLRINISHRAILATASVLTVAAAIFFFVSGRHLAPPTKAKAKAASAGSVKRILQSEAIYPYIMVFLGACVFSSMMNFQTTFAVAKGLDFSLFYGAYTLAVIFGRFFLSGTISRRNPVTMMLALLTLMCAAILSFLHVGNNAPLYLVGAATLGLSYGLVYPLIQAYAVNVSATELREEVLVYFSLAYFAGVYGFPLIAGKIIVGYNYDVFIGVLFALACMEFLVALLRSIATRYKPRQVAQK